jgi:hypothetical protein
MTVERGTLLSMIQDEAVSNIYYPTSEKFMPHACIDLFRVGSYVGEDPLYQSVEKNAPPLAPSF